MAVNGHKSPSPSWTATLAAKLANLNCGDTNSSTMQNDKSQPPTPEASGLPTNFQIIAPGIYRSSYPAHEHLEDLADLELKTIVTLVPEPLPFEYANFISSNGIHHHHIPILANKNENVFTSAETVNQVLSIMLEPANFPMLLHCNKGKHRTGCMTACFRKVTGWQLQDCIDEYTKYSWGKSRELDKAFITKYDDSVLKGIALERGYVGGVYGPHLFNSAQSSAYSTYSNASVETDTTIASDLTNKYGQSAPKNDYHEKAFKQRAADLESSKLWSHK